MEKYINPGRILLLIKKDIFQLYSNIGIALGAVVGVFIFINVFSMSTSSTADFIDMFKFILYVGGLIIASMTFVDMHKKERIHHWLMLPSSHLEKLVARLTISTIGYISLTIITVFFISLISALLFKLIFDISYPISNYLFNPFAKDVWAEIPHFMVLQTVFLMGGAYFKKMHFVKTVLSLVLMGIMLIIIAGVLAKMFFLDAANISITLTGVEFANLLKSMGNSVTATVVKYVALCMYWIAIPSVCLLVSYFRICEAEVHHGI